MNKPEHHIFVCSSSRINGQQKGFCISKNSAGIVGRFLEEISDRELEDKIMVTNTGCLSLCNQGPVVILYPEGVWYGGVTEDDVEDIIDAIENGEVLERLAL
ncbi:2Fe-2S ferredoxin [Bacillota bacterium LX-D]|nr:2Fe-2S ferredoxin [Bacillota bacterium LX-D]